MLINSAQLPHTNDSTFAAAPHPTTTWLSTQWYDCSCQKGLPTHWFLCSICSAALPMKLSCRSTQLTMSVVSSATTIWRSDTHPIVFILVSSDALGRPQATLFTEVPQPMSVPKSHPDGPKVGTKISVQCCRWVQTHKMALNVSSSRPTCSKLWENHTLQDALPYEVNVISLASYPPKAKTCKCCNSRYSGFEVGIGNKRGQYLQNDRHFLTPNQGWLLKKVIVVFATKHLNS